MKKIICNILLFPCICIVCSIHAQTDCQQFLKSLLLENDPLLSSIKVTMVTLNNKGVASFTYTRLYYEPLKVNRRGFITPAAFRTLRINQYGEQQPKFDFGKEAQVFSDRMGPSVPCVGGDCVGLTGWHQQKFEYSQADDLNMEITDAPEVQVTLTLRSWNNVTISFKASCAAGGFLTGETNDTQYTIFIEKWYR